MPGTHWGDQERSLIYQMNVLGLSVEEVVIPGKSKHAIRTKARRLLLIPSCSPRYEWTRREKILLKKLKKAGYTVLQIFESGVLASRSLNAIRKQWERKKLSDPKRRRASRNKKVWKGDELDTFKAFLLENSEKLTPQQIAKKWKVSRACVSRWQNFLGVKLTWHQVMASSYSRRKQKKGRASAREKLAKINSEKLLNTIAQFDLDAELLMREYPHRPTRVCASCNKKRPLAKKFFHYSQKKGRNKKFPTMTSRVYMRKCRICVNQERRDKKV